MKKAQGERLSPKLEAVLARLCQQLGPLLTTKAVKLPYLVDIVATHHLGERITHGTYQTWEHGVVTAEVWSYIQKGGDVNGPFEIREHSFSESGKQISLAGKPDEDVLNPEEETIVDYVANAYGRLDAGALGKLTKSLNTQFDARAWGQNHTAPVDEDTYARLSESYQAFCDRLSDLDLGNEANWGEPIEDPHEYLRRELGG